MVGGAKQNELDSEMVVDEPGNVQMLTGDGHGRGRDRAPSLSYVQDKVCRECQKVNDDSAVDIESDI